VDAGDVPRAAPAAEFQFAESGRRWQRAGDARVVPHIVVPAAGLARRLSSGLGLALNADGANGLPLYPESVSYLARLAPAGPQADPAAGSGASGTSGTSGTSGAAALWPPGLRPSAGWPLVQGRPDARQPGTGQPGTGQPGLGQAGGWQAGRRAGDEHSAAAAGVGHPPVEPRALLDETRAGLRGLRFVRYASRAWLTVPGAGEGLVISVTLDDPGSEARRGAVINALERACAAIPLRVPFPVDATFPGEILPGMTSPSPDMIDEWISRNTRPFYTRD
jgi:hypothetical protein